MKRIRTRTYFNKDAQKSAGKRNQSVSLSEKKTFKKIKQALVCSSIVQMCKCINVTLMLELEDKNNLTI